MLTQTSEQIYGEMYSFIRNFCESPTKDISDMSEFIKELAKKNEETYKKFKTFDKQFDSIRNSEKDTDSKLKELDDLINANGKAINNMDLAMEMVGCEEIYSNIWNKLDDSTKTYLATAHYLYKIANQNLINSSPSVLEFGKAFENELIKKIFQGVINDASHYEYLDYDERYKDLSIAVSNYLKNGYYYIPDRSMVKYLKYLGSDNISSEYKELMLQFIARNNIDAATLSDDNFTSRSDDYFAQYRNKAAHAGNDLTNDDLSKCKEKSKKLLKQFVKAF